MQASKPKKIAAESREAKLSGPASSRLGGPLRVLGEEMKNLNLAGPASSRLGGALASLGDGLDAIEGMLLDIKNQLDAKSPPPRTN
jgi:hypothetical protein